jgi:hypothetical protein
MSERQYWIGVVSKDHVDAAIAGSFAQLNHGKAGPLERMRQGDGLIFYSPRASYPKGEPLQAFTGIGRIRSGEVYQAEADNGNDIRPFRLDVDYLPASSTPVKPLIQALSFIRSKDHWGSAFRFGVVRIAAADFDCIAQAMGRSLQTDFEQ